jgi:hypothetical protein
MDADAENNTEPDEIERGMEDAVRLVGTTF